MLRNQSSPVVTPSIYYNLKLQRYPPDTTAFLYYSTSPDRPRIAGELRLRVASSDDHASFESGSDLLINGQPWSRSLYQVSKFYLPLYEKLREDGFVSDELNAILSSYPSRVSRCQLLYKLNDKFIIDFSITLQSLFAITMRGVTVLTFSGPWIEQRHNKARAPYKGAYTNKSLLPNDDSNKAVGSALARFERSGHPDHNGTKTVVLRILKIITPVECVIPGYDGHIPQAKEGELHRRYTRSSSHNKLHHPVWSVNIDKPKSRFVRGLRLLWDV